MVGARVRRQQVAYTRSRGLSARRACAVLSVARSTLGYQSRLAVRDAPALTAMRRLAAQYPRYGYRRIRIFLRREGHVMSPDRTHRLWRQAGLQVPRRRPRRRVATGRPRPLPPTARNHVWAYDFVFDTWARFDRKRKKRTSNKDWRSPSDPDAKVAKMKDGRTHLAHKAEHAIDLESGALVAVTLQDADQGDTTTIVETAIAAAEQVEAAHAAPDEEGLHEIVADKGYHSNETMVDLAAVGLRSYISEPDRGRRDWSDAPAAQAPVYRNRRRLRGARGRRLRRRRAELAERSFAHLYETGGDATHASARTREHLEAPADSWWRLQLGARDAPVSRPRQAAALAGPGRGGHDRLHRHVGPPPSYLGGDDPGCVDRSPLSSPRHRFELLPVAA